VMYNTYLDTSNPFLSHLPHPLHDTYYFASKTNILNVYFMKKAWAWTSTLFFFSWLTSPPNMRTKEGIFKWLAETASWLVFTSWFFGPAIIERVIVASGGACVLALPDGNILDVPQEYCSTKSTLSPVTHPSLFASSLLPSEWHATPRFRKGHDLSGHIFLLTMSILFLTDHLRTSFRAKAWSPLHKWAVGVNLALIGIWLFACYTTSVYFHSPFEKFTGFLLGVASFSITQLAIFKSSTTARPHQS